MSIKKFICEPVSPFIVHQYFGENRACVDLETNKKVISCDGTNPPVGYRSLYGPKGHTGIDLATTHGQPVYCVCNGVVDTIDTQEKSGLDVRVRSEIGGIWYRHIYEHLLGYQPKIGDIIKTGDLIGWADNTGYSSGDHLHFQLEKWVDNIWVPIDPIPVMSNIYALKSKGIESKLSLLKEKVAVLADLLAEFLRNK